MDRRCSTCKQVATLYVHSLAEDEHRWDHGDESLCPCVPALLCAVCHHGLLDGQALILLGDEDAPKQESALVH
jgi:hypothetical protein